MTSLFHRRLSRITIAVADVEESAERYARGLVSAERIDRTDSVVFRTADVEIELIAGGTGGDLLEALVFETPDRDRATVQLMSQGAEVQGFGDGLTRLDASRPYGCEIDLVSCRK